MCNIGGLSPYKWCTKTKNLHFDLYRSDYISVRTPKRAKNICLFFPALISQRPLTVIKFNQQETLDTISSCWRPPFLRTSATNLLNQHTPQTFFIFFSPFADYFQWVEVRAQEEFRISNSPERLTAWLPTGCPSYLLCLKPPCERPGLYFGHEDMINFCLLPGTYSLSVLSTISLKSEVINSADFISLSLTYIHVKQTF